MNIQVFIFNWQGQYEKVKEKIKQFADLGITPTIINSDESHNDEGWVNVGNDAYFTAQMLKALELFDGDILFHVQGDASYGDWKAVMDDAKKYYELYNWGVYAPNVDYSWYDSSRTDIDDIAFPEENLRMVACTDCTCWFIHKDIIDQFKAYKIDMSPYKMGWGWDILFPSFSFMQKRPVIRDYAHTVQHPEGTNYDKYKAEAEMKALFESLNDILKSLFYYIKIDRQKLSVLFQEQENA